MFYFPTLDQCIFGYQADYVDILATKMGCQNPLQLFQVCGENWGVCSDIISTDFTSYLWNNKIPHYVMSYVYKEIKNS